MFANLPQPSSYPTPAELAQKATNLSRQIFDDYTLLNKILTRHEEVLRKRWMKKTKEQRKKTLLSVWPKMPASHRPEFQALAKETPQQRLSETRFKESFMWPDINLDDLVHPRLLLLLLNSRGRQKPHVFAHTDYNASHIGQISGAIHPAFLNEYTMLLTGQTTSETYGRLVSWDDHEQAFEWMQSGLQFHPGHGLLVLEIQQHILHFLVDCCYKVFQDLPGNSLIDETLPELPEPPPILANETAYQSLAVMAAEAPYRIPAHLDLDRIRTLVCARRTAAEDHIWSLREDPSYFAQTVREWQDHRQETLLDTKGAPHPVLKENLFWDRVLGSMVTSVYGSFIIWDKISQQASTLATLQQKYAAVINPDESLPRELEKSFLTFRYLLEQASKGPIGELKVAVPSSPPLRSLFVREPQKPNSTIISVHTKSGVGSDPVVALFSILWDERQLFLCTLPKVVNEMQRLIQDDSKQMDKLSPLVAQMFSDLALMAETRHQIELFQPWASQFEEKEAQDFDSIQKEFASSMSLFADLLKNSKGMPSLANIGSPFQNRFKYPVEKRRTRQTTEDMRQAEHNLDVFWQAIDQHFKNKSPNSCLDRVQLLMDQSRELERTPEWVEPTKKPRIETVSDVETLHQPFSRLHMEVQEGAQKHDQVETSAVKEKMKTRGFAQPPQQDNAAQATDIPQPLPPDRQPSFAVGKRALKVFSTLFFMPNQTDEPGEVAWGDFVHAMVSIGFSAEKLYGSAWQFNPVRLDVMHGEEMWTSAQI